MIDCIKCYTSFEDNYDDIISCTICENIFHKQCFSSLFSFKNHDEDEELYICFECRVRTFNPYFKVKKMFLPKLKYNYCLLEEMASIEVNINTLTNLRSLLIVVPF